MAVCRSPPCRHRFGRVFRSQAIDANYRGHGIIEALVVLDDAPKMAQTPGVGSLVLQLKPMLSAGPSIAQRVNLHRVNRINKGYNPAASQDITGTGISDSESAALMTLGPGKYTSIVRGADNSTGIGLAEAYELDN